MTKILATPYERGNADQIVSRKYAEKVLEGLAVYETNNGMKILTSGNNPTGIAGRQGLAAGDVVVSGRKIYVQCPENAKPTAFASVYVDPDTGLFTEKSTQNFLKINATFAKDVAVVKCMASDGNLYNAVCIDMPAPMGVLEVVAAPGS
ncbi:hypothetical protein [Phascolarctobacterium faecium]|uniref:hypothetical protein n=1 Tax=Phascolarctobacterium faecium TaxID=33025 RepID=UPI00242C5587|nr:hypothetical protein [Phascolarctobacterium faecium]